MEFPDVIVTWKRIGPATREGLVILGALFLVISLILVWAVFVRKRRRKRKHRYHHPSRDSHRDVLDGAPTDEAAPAKKKWRRRRRDHRPRNPTLSETGGLPPIRPSGGPGPPI